MSTSPNPAVTGLPEPMSMGEVLRVPIMRRLWIAQLVSTFGDFLALFAVIGVLTFKLKDTAQQVTGLQIAYLLPIAVLGILAGVFVDRWPLKPTLVVSDLTRSALCLLLLLATKTFHFYAILACISILSSFFSPAQGVAIRSAVPMHGLRSANALMQQVLFGMRIVGPGLATILFTTFGPRICYMADAASFLASGCLIASLTLKRVTPEDKQSLETPLDTPAAAPSAKPGLSNILPDMRQGISFIVHHAAVLFVIVALAAGMFVLGCFGPLIAVYVRDSLHASTKIYGTASTMIGIGMFLGVNLLNTVGKKIKNSTLVYGGLGGIAIGLCFLAFLLHIWATVIGTLIIGIAVAGIVVPSNTLIQQETPAALMGRVGSTVMSLVFSAQIAGLILSGLLANRIGVRHVFAVCGLLLVVLIIAGKLFMEPKPVPATT
ncbi:MFS transporter [Granulicella tundricola]|nr:MFS transporter [Granulicella tundricola]